MLQLKSWTFYDRISHLQALNSRPQVHHCFLTNCCLQLIVYVDSQITLCKHEKTRWHGLTKVESFRWIQLHCIYVVEAKIHSVVTIFVKALLRLLWSGWFSGVLLKKSWKIVTPFCYLMALLFVVKNILFNIVHIS